MKIYKAFLHTIFLVGLQTLIGIAIVFFFQLIDKNNNYYVHVLGLIRTLAQLSGFLIFSYYFWKPWNNWIKKCDLKTDNFKIILLLFIIGIGYELIKSPFVDFNNLLKYINQTDSIYHSPSFDGFDINLIYRVIGAIIIAPAI